MGTIQLVGSIVMIAMFSIMVIAFGVQFAVDNSPSVSIADDNETMNFYSGQQSNVTGLRGSTNDEYQSIIETTIPEGSDYPQSMAAFSKSDESSKAVVENVITLVRTKLFGNDPTVNYVITAAMGFLVLVLGLYVYKTIRGLPD